ncbi:BTB/POZ protein [Rhizophagus clarus]|uniref:BTB/POZ protein n=1 Tax=Rhizophagus clarus TaxID=94130 RepID=A0A8H3QP23_9GLOM|nr:BTB/POZ protein [Rhizophagus clarus]
MDDNEFLPKLSQNLLEILDDEEYYDITIEVGNDPNKNDETLTHIKLPNILPETFQIILRYIYGGRISLKEYNNLDIFNILVAANELSLQELISYLQSFLIKNKVEWMKQNFNLIYQTSFENDSFLDLQKFCTELISKQPEKIFNSTDFTSISEKVLISLIKHDKIQISEAQVWEHVLEWGIAQNPGLPSDPSNYSNDDFNTLKDTLKRCITFIKFNKFTSKEFLDNAYPYKKIFPKELYENSIKYFLENIETCLISRVQNKARAVGYCNIYGPSFGGGDLTIYGGDHRGEVSLCNKTSYCIKTSYEKQIRKTEEHFSVEEYEVFQVMNDIRLK